MPQRLILFGLILGLSPLLWGATCHSGRPDAYDELAAIMEDIERIRDCAPELYRAAKDMLAQARASLKEEDYDRADVAQKVALHLADQAWLECERERSQLARLEWKKRLEQERAGREAEYAVRELPVDEENSGPESLLTVYFGFDEHLLTDEAREILTDNSEYLRLRRSLRIRVEGHCDERGPTEYNLALGERRARAVKNYLVGLGIPAERIETISFGKEHPAAEGHDESAWAKNRRSEFNQLIR
jgi:peptidoglycan-associated lipoprotein